MDRPRHEKLIAKVRKAGAAVRLITDGDVAGVIATTDPRHRHRHLYRQGRRAGRRAGGGGACAASAARCRRGWFQQRRQKRERARAAGIKDLNRKYTMNDMASGDVMLCRHRRHRRLDARGRALQHGRRSSPESVVMRSATGTVRWIRTAHHDASKFEPVRRLRSSRESAKLRRSSLRCRCFGVTAALDDPAVLARLAAAFLGVEARARLALGRAARPGRRTSPRPSRRPGLPGCSAACLPRAASDVRCARRFLNPTIRDTPARPFDAGRRWTRRWRGWRARSRQASTIAVFGDYDVDGSVSTALMEDFLRAPWARAARSIFPTACTEGYGPSPPAMRRSWRKAPRWSSRWIAAPPAAKPLAARRSGRRWMWWCWTTIGGEDAARRACASSIPTSRTTFGPAISAPRA